MIEDITIEGLALAYSYWTLPTLCAKPNLPNQAKFPFLKRNIRSQFKDQGDNVIAFGKMLMLKGQTKFTLIVTSICMYL